MLKQRLFSKFVLSACLTATTIFISACSEVKFSTIDSFANSSCNFLGVDHPVGTFYAFKKLISNNCNAEQVELTCGANLEITPASGGLYPFCVTETCEFERPGDKFQYVKYTSYPEDGGDPTLLNQTPMPIDSEIGLSSDPKCRGINISDLEWPMPKTNPMSVFAPCMCDKSAPSPCSPPEMPNTNGVGCKSCDPGFGYDSSSKACIDCSGSKQYMEGGYCKTCSGSKVANSNHTDCVDSGGGSTVPAGKVIFSASVDKNGDSGGGGALDISVNCDPASVDVGKASTCSITNNSAHYNFVNWTKKNSTAVVSANANFSVTPDNQTSSPQEYVAHFTRKTLVITTSAVLTGGGGAGGGTVVCSPNMNSGASSNNFTVRSGEPMVSCTANPDSGKQFSTWTGDCGGSTCQFQNISLARSVTANFENMPAGNVLVELAVLPANSGAGTITCTANSINYSQTFSVTKGGSYSCQAQVANSNYEFDKWSGDCTGSSSCSQTNLQAATRVVAEFKLKPTVPGSPTNVVHDRSNSPKDGVRITFAPPAATTSAGQILDYTATCTLSTDGTKSKSETSSSTTITVSDLGAVLVSNSSEPLYRCSVVARNSVGSGAASNDVFAPVTPRDVSLTINLQGNGVGNLNSNLPSATQNYVKTSSVQSPININVPKGFQLNLAATASSGHVDFSNAMAAEVSISGGPGNCANAGPTSSTTCTGQVLSPASISVNYSNLLYLEYQTGTGQKPASEATSIEQARSICATSLSTSNERAKRCLWGQTPMYPVQVVLNGTGSGSSVFSSGLDLNIDASNCSKTGPALVNCQSGVLALPAGTSTTLASANKQATFTSSQDATWSITEFGSTVSTNQSCSPGRTCTVVINKPNLKVEATFTQAVTANCGTAPTNQQGFTSAPTSPAELCATGSQLDGQVASETSTFRWNCKDSTGSIGCSAKRSYLLTVTRAITPSGSGTGSTVTIVVGSSAPIACSDANSTTGCSPSFTYGASVNLTATVAAASGDYAFANWGGVCSASSTNSCTVSMTQAQTVTANFVQKKKLILQALDQNSNHISGVSFNPSNEAWSSKLSPSLQQSSVAGSITYTVDPSLARFTVQAALAGTLRSPFIVGTRKFAFDKWEGNSLLNSVVTMSSPNVTLTAWFKEVFQITAGANSDAGGTVQCSAAVVLAGTSTTCSATVHSNGRSIFKSWNIVGSTVSCAAGSTSCLVSPTANATVTGIFECINPGFENVVASASGTTVWGAGPEGPFTVDSDKKKMAMYLRGQAGATYSLSWSEVGYSSSYLGDSTGKNGVTTSPYSLSYCGGKVTARTVSAATVSLQLSPQVGGTIEDQGVGALANGTRIKCSNGVTGYTKCDAPVDVGASITLIATPSAASGYSAVSWGGCPASSGTQCTYTAPTGVSTSTISVTFSGLSYPQSSYTFTAGTAIQTITASLLGAVANGSGTCTSSPSLPSGLIFESGACNISGTPTTAGTASHTVSLTRNGVTVSRSITITVNAQTPPATDPCETSWGSSMGDLGPKYNCLEPH